MYILGAGASIGAKRLPESDDWLRDRRMPSGDNFFYDILVSDKEYGATGTNFLNLLGATHEGLNLLLHQTYKLDDTRSFYDGSTWKGLNIESVFTHFDIGTKMYPKGSAYQKVFLEAKRSLVRFITLMLTMRSYGQYCGYLERLFGDLSDLDTVVSFNWDTIADVTLEKHDKAHFKNYVALITGHNRITTYYSAPVYLKLHGSLNWATCRNDKCKSKKTNTFIRSKKGNIAEITLADYPKCKSCNSVMEINIIPPVSEKIEIHQNSLYNRQWKIARRKLQQSRRLVFIGYSFPSTDCYAEWLFRQINYLVEEMRPQPKFTKIEIDVVNPAACKRGSQLKKRYASIFRGHDLKYYKTLEEYVAIKKAH